MKVYAIYDENSETDIAYLFHYEKSNSYIIELEDNLSKWKVPVFFSSFVKKGKTTINKEFSYLWIKERIIPSGRQNIGYILKNHKLKHYNEMALLELSKGRCSQDNCYIKKINYEVIPKNIKNRTRKNISECFTSDMCNIICLLNDERVVKVDLTKLTNLYPNIVHILNNDRIFNSVKVGVGGYSISFNDSIEIDVTDLIDYGEVINLSSRDFYNFVEKNTIDTMTACDILQCTKQNISYLIKKKILNPIKQLHKDTLFLRGVIEKNNW